MLRTGIVAAPASALLALVLGLGGALVATSSASADTPEQGELLVDASTPLIVVEKLDTSAIIELPTLTFVEASASAVQPTCVAAGSFTLSPTPGVVWMLGVIEIAPGIHPAPAGTSVSIEATPYLGGFTDDVRTNWTFDFTAPAGCDGGIDGVENPTAPDTPSTDATAAANAPIATELPTLAVTGTTEQAVIIGLVALLLTVTGAGMVVAGRRASA